MQAVEDHDDVEGAIVERQGLGAADLVGLVGDRGRGSGACQLVFADLQAYHRCALARHQAHEGAVAAADIEHPRAFKREGFAHHVGAVPKRIADHGVSITRASRRRQGPSVRVLPAGQNEIG